MDLRIGADPVPESRQKKRNVLGSSSTCRGVENPSGKVGQRPPLSKDADPKKYQRILRTVAAAGTSTLAVPQTLRN